jgi:hypothetical protein
MRRPTLSRVHERQAEIFEPRVANALGLIFAKQIALIEIASPRSGIRLAHVIHCLSPGEVGGAARWRPPATYSPASSEGFARREMSVQTRSTV